MKGKTRQDKRIQERVHDPYRSREKLTEPQGCPDCGAVYRNGRWQWDTVPFEAEETRCPACQRVADNYPAGEITLSGPFLEQHRDELLALARHTAEQQTAEHPLKRIMGVVEGEKQTVVTTTDLQLARAIGEALHRAYEGELDYRYGEGESFLRVRWRR